MSGPGLTGTWADNTADVDALLFLLGGRCCSVVGSVVQVRVPGIGRFDIQAAAEVPMYGLIAGSAVVIGAGGGTVGAGAAKAAASGLPLLGCIWLGRRLLGPADLGPDPDLARAMMSMWRGRWS